MDRISVIVPVYNCAAELGRCLGSLLAQEDVDLQIVAVDDGSSDNGWEVLRTYAAADSRVTALHQENRGVTAARLAGIKAAAGEWIGFVDGDDVVDPGMYRRLLHNAQEADASISHCGHRILFPDGRTEYRYNTAKKMTQDHLQGLQDLLDGGQIESSLCTKIYRRELFDGVEDWMDRSLRNGEDLLMNYYLFDRAEKSVYEDFCPYAYILRDGSASRKPLGEHTLFDPVRARELILERCGEEMKDDARRALLRNLLFAYALASQQPGKTAGAFKTRARKMLREQKQYFPLLSARNRVLGQMICIAPWSFDIAYGAFVRLFQREEQH